MTCRTRKPHWHFHDELNSVVYCEGCGVECQTVWLRCHDNKALCDHCYWDDPDLRRHMKEDPL